MTDTAVAVAVVELTEPEARELTDQIASNVENLWQLIGTAFERKAWSALGYSSWEGYTETEFGMSRGQAYRLVDQARTVAALEAAAGLEPGTLGADVVSARAAADLKPVLEEVVEQVADATKGRRRSERPAIAREVVTEARKTTSATKKAADPLKPPASLPSSMSLDSVMGALLKHPPVEARELSNNRWANVRSWLKQADAVRNPIDASATETTSSKSKGSSKKAASSGKAQTSAKSACKHPVNRRIGDQCAECGETVK